MDRAKVSVIIPAYNSEQTLARCLGNLVHQTLDGIELIVVNDCSTDSTWNIICECERQFSDKIIAVNSERNRGAGGARNVGLGYASGEYIGFVDSDDQVDVTMFEKLYNEAKRGNYDIVDAGFFNEDTGASILYTSDALKGELTAEKRCELILSTSYTVTKIYRAELIREIIPFRENIILEDSDWMIDALCKAHSIGNVKACLYIYKDTPGSTSKCTDPDKYFEATTEAISAVYGCTHSRDDYYELQEAIECFLLNMGALCLGAMKITGRADLADRLGEILAGKIELEDNHYAEKKMDKADYLAIIEHLKEHAKSRKTVIIPRTYSESIRRAWERQGFTTVNSEKVVYSSDEELEESLAPFKNSDAAVFTYNYFPNVAEAAERHGLKYISWIWDCPCASLWHRSVNYEGNYIFAFDLTLYAKLQKRGIKHSYYLPLAADIDKFDEVIANASDSDYAGDVVFVGSMYNTPEHSMYDRISYLPPYVRGYLDSLMRIQIKVWGADMLDDGIPSDMWPLIKECVKLNVSDKYVDDYYEVSFKQMVGQKIAQLERKEICSDLASRFNFSLYTDSDTSFDPAIRNLGQVDYNTQMPVVFHNSKINLHTTIKNIPSGIPLRVLDVLACGGFLLTNYQPEIAEYFEDGVDLVMYGDHQDLYAKIEYYLEHEEERLAIAQAGYAKVRKYFNYDLRVASMVQAMSEV